MPALSSSRAGPASSSRTRSGPHRRAVAGAVGMLTGDAGQMADTVLGLRATLGIDEFVVPADLAEFFVPVISRLAG